MGVIAQAVIASPSDAQAVLNSDQPINSWDGFAYKGLDRVGLITLWALVETDDPDNRFDYRLDAVRVITDADRGRWVDIIPPEMLAALAKVAALDAAEFDRLGLSWWRTDEFEGWDEAEVLDLLRLLGDLAESAQIESKTLLLWAEP